MPQEKGKDGWLFSKSEKSKQRRRGSVLVADVRPVPTFCLDIDDAGKRSFLHLSDGHIAKEQTVLAENP
jgi:hypothetical protein